ncbi:hypothetical protein JCGZ_10122 [Jatropha curcas]|uniref:Transcription and mRNA export factor ENY2 n=1 Tax=Jatropha curcas TaxID=180498 RepID=A0A067LD30_JATCU|nr:hypothetical protein JCGZ_10122 [Jatropha curcas]
MNNDVVFSYFTFVLITTSYTTTQTMVIKSLKLLMMLSQARIAVARFSQRNSVNRPPTPDAAEDPGKEPSLQEIINIKLIESGEKERLMELLRERLIECGWKDEMKALCRAFIKKKGRNNVTVDDLVHVITPKGRVIITNQYWSRITSNRYGYGD